MGHAPSDVVFVQEVRYVARFRSDHEYGALHTHGAIDLTRMDHAHYLVHHCHQVHIGSRKGVTNLGKGLIGKRDDVLGLLFRDRRFNVALPMASTNKHENQLRGILQSKCRL